jgi:adenylate cyclase
MLLVVLAVRVKAPHVIEFFQLQVFDAYQRIEPRPYTPVPVKIIDIDDESLERIGQWPWPRTLLARVIEILFEGNPTVLALDILLAEPDRTSPRNILPLWPDTPEIVRLRDSDAVLPDHDEILADAMRERNVVVGFVLNNQLAAISPKVKWRVITAGDRPQPYLPNFSGAVLSLAPIEASAAGNGSFNLVPEPDSITRRLHLMFRQGGTIYPSLAAETLRVAFAEPTYVLRSAGKGAEPVFGGHTGLNTVSIGGLAVPTDAHGRVWMHYTRPEPSRYLPAWKLFEPGFDPSEVEGYVLLLGTTAPGLGDTQATPLNPVMAGVEVHASLIEQILLGHFLARPGWAEAAELLYMLVLGLLLVVLLTRLSAFGCAVLGMTTVALAVTLSWYSYTRHGWLIDPVGPSLAALLIYLAASLTSFMRSEARRRHLRSAFGHYLAPTVIEQLLEDPNRLKLGGERRETTFLFTDIAGFTGLTERIEPAELVRLLNEYLDETCSIVFRNGGTIDKIVGDALHVMFNAPSDQPDHAQRAVTCAIELDDFCHRFSETKRASGTDFGETRIGVNTGYTVVGNFGGTQRFDYTAHGDAINTAARLESVNQHLGTRVCVSGSATRSCEGIGFRPVASLVLKGKTDGIDVFEPVPEGSVAESGLEGYRAAFRLLEAGDPTATDAFTRLSEQHPNDALVAFHLARLRAGDTGVRIVMTSK